jgi:putative MFS transporter
MHQDAQLTLAIMRDFKYTVCPTRENMASKSNMSVSFSENIGGRIDRLPVSASWGIIAIIGIALFFDGFDNSATGVLLPSLIGSKFVQLSDTVYLVTPVLIALGIGSVIAGAAMDRFGRRLIFQVNLLGYSLAQVAAAFSPSAPWLIVLRTISGVFLGMEVVTGYAYLNELTPAIARGKFQSWAAFILNGGGPAVALAGAIVIPSLPLDLGWRVVLGLNAIAAASIYFVQRGLPESPRWLYAVGRKQEADTVLKRIEDRIEKRTGKPLPSPVVVASPAVGTTSWSDLFKKKVFKRLLLGIDINVIHLMAIFIFITWLPLILVRAGMSFLQSFVFFAIVFCGAFLGPFIATFVSDRIDRKWLTVCGATLAAVFGILFSVAGVSILLALVGLGLTSAIFFISAITFSTYVPEIFPTGIRGRGTGTCVFIGRIAAGLVQFAIIPMVASTNPFAIVTVVGILYIIMGVSVGIFGPKTSKRILESIEEAVVTREVT